MQMTEFHTVFNGEQIIKFGEPIEVNREFCYTLALIFIICIMMSITCMIITWFFTIIFIKYVIC